MTGARKLPAATVRRFTLAEECLRATRVGRTPIDTMLALGDGAFFVELRPAEFARFALAVASVRWQQSQAVRP